MKKNKNEYGKWKGGDEWDKDDVDGEGEKKSRNEEW